MQTLILPMFPLQLVAFPGELLNLHIFEPRYKQLIHECEANGKTFGIPAFIEGKVQEIGTEIELLAIDKRYSNGELDIRTRGVGIFKTLEYFPHGIDRLYSTSEVIRIPHGMEGDFVINEKILGHLSELYRVMNITKPLPEHTPDFSTYTVAHLVGFSIEQEYEMLCIPEEIRRQEYMLAHLENLLPAARQMEELRLKVQMNGHFKNLLPPEA